MNEKDYKKQLRAEKRDARKERWYGKSLFRRIADYECEANRFWVADYYYQYRNKNQEKTIDLVFMGIFLLLQLLDLVMLIIKPDGSWGYSFGINGMLMLYWLQCVRICDIEADRLADKLISLASEESKRKAVEAETGKKFTEDGDDKVAEN